MTDDQMLCSTCFIWGFCRPSFGNLCSGCHKYGLCAKCEKKNLCFICREGFENYDPAKDPRLGSVEKLTALWTRHGKERGITNLDYNGDGTYNCKPDQQCMEKAVKAKVNTKAKTKPKAKRPELPTVNPQDRPPNGPTKVASPQTACTQTRKGPRPNQTEAEVQTHQMLARTPPTGKSNPRTLTPMSSATTTSKSLTKPPS